MYSTTNTKEYIGANVSIVDGKHKGVEGKIFWSGNGYYHIRTATNQVYKSRKKHMILGGVRRTILGKYVGVIDSIHIGKVGKVVSGANGVYNIRSSKGDLFQTDMANLVILSDPELFKVALIMASLS